MKNVAVIGGGITGLSAAFYLQKEAQEQNIPLSLNVFESSDRLGGKVRTSHQDGFVIERGADSFLARKKPGMALMESLGIEDKLYRNETGQAYVLVNNELHSLPSGSFMGLPVQEEPFRHSNVLSEAGKERALEEVTLPKGPAEPDQPLGGFLRRRFGDELVDHLLAPLLSGIYSSEIDEMSLMASFPNFYKLEQEYGSVLKGLRETMPERRAETGKKPSQFVSVEGGLSTIIEALEGGLSPSLRKNTAVREIEKNDDSYIIRDTHRGIHEADTVIIAVPHKEVPEMFSDTDIFAPLKSIPVKSVANVVLAFRAEDTSDIMDGTGFVVSKTSDVRITACTWTHKKWPATTPEGKALLRAYVGRPDDQEIVRKSDAEITNIVREDLRNVMGLDAEPEFSTVTRWEELMPQYTVGHAEKIKQVEQRVKQHFPGVYLAGSSFHGVGLPDCIDQAKQAQEAALAYLTK